VNLPRILTKDDLLKLRNKKIGIISIVLFWWSIPLIAIYIFGLGIAWLISRFYKSKD